MEARLGIPKLEKAFGNYVKYGDVIAITGPTGIGKSTLAMQLLINGIKFGDRCLYIVMEYTKNYFYKTFENYIWNIKEYEELGTLLVIDYPFSEISHFTGMGNPLKEIIRKYDIKRVVVDSVLPIYASTKTEKETITALINATEKMKEWNCLTLVIAESEQNHFPASQSKVESYVDSWIAMYYDTKEDEWKRQLRVIKSRAKHDITPLNFYIDKTGIVFE